MYDTPSGRPHGPAPDAGPDEMLVGELRELMEQAAAGLPALPDLTEEAVRQGGRRRVRARAAVAGAVTGVLAIGGVGAALLGGLGDHASAPVGPAAVPPAVPSPTPTPPPTSTAPTSGATPDATLAPETALRTRTAEALNRALGDLIGTVSADGAGRYASRLDGHTFPVTLRVEPGSDALVHCPDPPETTMTCRTAWLPGRIEARVVEVGGALWGGRTVSVSYHYADSAVKLTVGPDTAARLSPPVTADQLLAAAGTPALLSEVRAEVQDRAPHKARDDQTNPSDGASRAPAATTQPFDSQSATVEPRSATDLGGTDSTSKAGGFDE
ncbi:hypothetical protein AB0945_15515 [Streptomyces sp. NPDC005474]|uniref:hypothetical protein n=1 Tax=Streptomyces sp. NPDC005474 TaxID=3154878 RepID=UPI003456D19D